MNFKKFLNQINFNPKEDRFYLSFLILFSTLLIICLIDFNLKLGIYCSDVLVYLTNALAFAGERVTSSNTLYLSPVICFLTSILFRLGLKGEIAIYIVTGLFAIFGNIGLYLLLKNKFSPLLSLTGSVLFSSFSLNLLWLANGTLDIPAVALSIWVILFTIIAVDKNEKFYLLAFPLWVIAFFTRYTVALILPLMILYFLFKINFFYYLDLLISDFSLFKKEFKLLLSSERAKYFFKGIVISIVILVLFLLLISLVGSPLSFLTQGSDVVSGDRGSVIDNSYTTDTWFYIHDFLNFLFAKKVIFDGNIPNLIGANPFAYLIIFILGFGLILALIALFSNKFDIADENDLLDSHLDFNSNSDSYNICFKSKLINNKTLTALAIISLFLSVLSFKINGISSVFFLLLFTLALDSILKGNFESYSKEGYGLILLFMDWFLIYMVFFTFYDIKVNRYIITCLPAFVFFVVLALNYIYKFIFHVLNNNALSRKIVYLISILMILTCLFSAFGFTDSVEMNEEINSPKLMADYLIDYDANYSLKEVADYNIRYYNWLLKMNTIPLVDERLSYLDSSNITYYISNNEVELENYTMIHRENNLYLYEHI